MGYDVKILADSVNPVGDRVTTFELTYPRFVHAELMTHRLFCLAGDSELEFDLPSGQSRGGRRIHRMRLDEFVDKWNNGARRYGSKPKRETDLSVFKDDVKYSAVKVASLLGMASAGNINNKCRQGSLPATKEGETWYLLGCDVKDWRRSSPAENRYDMRTRLSRMQIRQLNEDTGDIQTARVIDAVFSGRKEVLEVRAGEFSIAGSVDHRVYTADGWKIIGELSEDDYLVVRKFGKREGDLLDPLRLKKINGRWRSVWQNKKRKEMQDADPLCRRCQTRPGIEIHHLVPVYQDPRQAFVDSNVTLLCEGCHKESHSTQGWQGGTYLYGALAKVDEIFSRGEEDTYDLSISGTHANFLANGVVVHNSRNSASSRAIPTPELIRRISKDPVLPKWWGKNQSGMQARAELDRDSMADAMIIWLEARDSALAYASELRDLGLHKQIANRILEPWMFITVIVTATEYDNWFYLRDSEYAQPEIAWVARQMRIQYDENVPEKVEVGRWHLPLVSPPWHQDHAHPLHVSWADVDRLLESGQEPILVLVEISAARCARVSYLTHDGVRDLEDDLRLHDKLSSNGHWSPFEHPARCLGTHERVGNFVGWRQYRKHFPDEHHGKVMP